VFSFECAIVTRMIATVIAAAIAKTRKAKEMDACAQMPITTWSLQATDANRHGTMGLRLLAVLHQSLH